MVEEHDGNGDGTNVEDGDKDDDCRDVARMRRIMRTQSNGGSGREEDPEVGFFVGRSLRCSSFCESCCWKEFAEDDVDAEKCQVACLSKIQLLVDESKESSFESGCGLLGAR